MPRNWQSEGDVVTIKVDKMLKLWLVGFVWAWAAIASLLVVVAAFAADDLPVQASVGDGPEGTVRGALACIDRYRNSKKLRSKFKYFDSWESAEKEVNDMAYAYEGMVLEQPRIGDFMKNHEIVIICMSKKYIKGYLHVVEEVIYPVWSKRNNAHVLRGVPVRRIIRSSGVYKGKRAYRGLDGQVHFVREAGK